MTIIHFNRCQLKTQCRSHVMTIVKPMLLLIVKSRVHLFPFLRELLKFQASLRRHVGVDWDSVLMYHAHPHYLAISMLTTGLGHANSISCGD